MDEFDSRGRVKRVAREKLNGLRFRLDFLRTNLPHQSISPSSPPFFCEVKELVSDVDETLPLVARDKPRNPQRNLDETYGGANTDR